MSAQAAIVINDGQGTPVAHTFNPKGAKRTPEGKDLADWTDASPAYMAGYLTIQEQHTPVNQNGIEKFRWVIDVPTLETAGSGAGPFVPPPTKAYSGVIVLEVWAHERSSSSELANLAAYLKNFAALNYVRDAIINREAAW